MKHLRTITALSIAVALLLLTGCQHNTPVDPPAVPVEVRVARYVQVVAVTNAGLVPIVSSLRDSGVISAENAQKIAQYQASVATATKGMSEILAKSEHPGPTKRF